MENIINLNERILSNYQKTYPNLQDFSYDASDDSLVYNGNKVQLNGYGLSRIDPVFFEMNPDDIFSYLKNGFYKISEESSHVNALFNQFVITEDEILYLEYFAKRFNKRCQIYANNKELLDNLSQTNENVKAFTKALLDEHSIIDIAKNQSQNSAFVNNAASVLYKAYLENLNDNALNNSESKDQEVSLEKGMALTRTKPGLGGFDEEEYIKEKNSLGIAGFSSIILVIAATIAFGIYLAVTVIK